MPSTGETKCALPTTGQSEASDLLVPVLPPSLPPSVFQSLARWLSHSHPPTHSPTYFTAWLHGFLSARQLLKAGLLHAEALQVHSKTRAMLWLLL